MRKNTKAKGRNGKAVFFPVAAYVEGTSVTVAEDITPPTVALKAPLLAVALGVALLALSMSACQTSRGLGGTSTTRPANLPPDDSEEVVFRKVRAERLKVRDENEQEGSVEAVTHSNGRPGGALILTRKQPRGHVELTTGIYGPGLYVRSPGSMKHGLWAYVQDNGFPASNLLLFFEGSKRAKIMG